MDLEILERDKYKIIIKILPTKYLRGATGVDL